MTPDSAVSPAGSSAHQIADRLTVFPATGPGPQHAGPEDSRPAVLVLPGGGYEMLADHEGAGYARWLSGLGLHAFVLAYPVAPARHPEPIEAAVAALSYLRSGDHGLAVDPHRVGVIGSSAGGHLAASLSVGIAGESAPRPDFAILCYPVISFLGQCHEGSAQNLLGPEATAGERRALSLEHRVDARTPPTFLWSTADDEAVPVSNSLRYAQALVDAGISTELHVLPHGAHGLGLAPDDPGVAVWSDSCETWLRTIAWSQPAGTRPA